MYIINDSLLLKKGGVKMAVFTNINLSDSTIDWCLSYYNDETELLRATDRYFFNIDLYEGGHIKVQNTPTQLSDIRGLAVDYIFILIVQVEDVFLLGVISIRKKN